MKNYRMDVRAMNGVDFRVILIPKGGESPHYNLGEITEAQVEFYDMRYSHTADGQFTGARYYVNTLMEGRGWYPGKPGGINLNGGIDSWKIDEDNYQNILDWVNTTLDRVDYTS